MKIKIVRENLTESDEAKIFFFAVILFSIVGIVSYFTRSNSVEIVEKTIEIHYINGTKENFVFQNHSSSMEKQPIFNNGCLYRFKKHSTIFKSGEYVGSLRCGVKYFKIKSTRKFIINKQ